MKLGREKRFATYIGVSKEKAFEMLMEVPHTFITWEEGTTWQERETTRLSMAADYHEIPQSQRSPEKLNKFYEPKEKEGGNNDQ